MNPRNYVVVAALLLAVPVGAQDTISVPGQTIVINGDSIFIAIEVNDLSADRIVEVFEALQASLDSATAALRDCDRCEEEAPLASTTNVVVDVGKNAVIEKKHEHEPEELDDPKEPKSEGRGEGDG